MISAVQRDAAEDRSMHLNSLCLMFSLTCWTTVKRSRGRCWLYHSGNSGRDTHAALCMSTTWHVNKHTQLIQHGRATQTQTPRWIQKYDFIKKNALKWILCHFCLCYLYLAGTKLSYHQDIEQLLKDLNSVKVCWNVWDLFLVVTSQRPASHPLTLITWNWEFWLLSWSSSNRISLVIK